MEAKVSIVIPVYNSEEYLEECLESVITQSYKNIEIILINDGSTDNSLNICYKFKKKDSRIKIINKKNTGVSDARNIGIINSTGNYIVFVDSDDYCEKSMVDTIIKNINDNDLLIFSYNKVCKKQRVKYNFEKIEINKENIESKIIDNDRIGGYLWNKVFKCSIVKENNLKFDSNITFGEDLLFVFEYIKKTKKILYIKETLYNYRIRKYSKTNDFLLQKDFSMLNVYSLLIDLTEKYDVKLKLKYNYLIMFYQFKKFKNLLGVRDDILEEEKMIEKKQTIKKKIKLKVVKYFPVIYWKLKKVKYKILY